MEDSKIEEYSVKTAAKVAGKKFNVFKMHRDDTISWVDSKMKRDNEFQPWQIKIGTGRTARRFKAVKEGGVGENTSYFIFFKPKNSNGPLEVCPVDEWYSMSATQRYKTLTAEEAEQKFEQRNKTLNMFSVMSRKGGETNEDGGTSGGSRGFKISEMDDWDNSGGDSGNSDFGDEDEAAKKKRRRAAKKEKDEPEDAPEEGKEDSDEGDFEQREVDYMSDTSSESEASESGPKEENDIKGIAEEEALKDLLDTDEEEDAVEGSPRKGMKPNKNKNTLGTVEFKQDGNNSEDSSDSDDYDVDEDKMDSMFAKKDLPARLVKPEPTDQPDNAGSSGSVKQPMTLASLQSNKRKADNNSSSTGSSSILPQIKRPCTSDYPSSSSSSSPPMSSLEKTIEEQIRKYLRRKPMTVKALLKDIKIKLKRMNSVTAEMDQNLVQIIASIINNRVKPEKQKIGDQTYLSLKN